LPGARAHCISVGRSAAQQRGCVSIPPQPPRREVPANSICRAATGSSKRCHASDQWRKRPRPAGWVTARLLSHLEAERLSPIVRPLARLVQDEVRGLALLIARDVVDPKRVFRCQSHSPVLISALSNAPVFRAWRPGLPHIRLLPRSPRI
jgi:hypothetical protein